MIGEPLKEDKVTASPVSDMSVKSGAGLPSSTKVASKVRRAVGVVRVSRVGDREGERFVSPKEQAERIASVAARDSLKLIETIEELDVSGGTPLAKRDGLRRAVELVEAGRADVVVVAYFDRLVRSLAVQAEVVERVERAGGAILAVDVGEVRADTASRWLSSTMLGMVAEYHRRATGERTVEAKRRAVARGVPPFANIPPGYRRRPDRTLELVPKEAKAVADAFRLRASGATVIQVRDFLRERGIVRSYHGVQAMLTSRFYLGELRFGEMVNTAAHEPIIDASTWRRVQRMISPRGRRPKSDRLLARIGVLCCATCGARMVVGTTRQQGRNYSFYRCPPVGDCPQRVTIGAEMVEACIVEAVQDLLQGVSGSASADTEVAAVRAEVDRLEAELDAAVLAFSGLDDVASAKKRLTELREARDAARDQLDDLSGAVLPLVSLTARDWDDLTITERQSLVKAMISRVTVAPGRGLGRVTIEEFPQ